MDRFDLIMTDAQIKEMTERRKLLIDMIKNLKKRSLKAPPGSLRIKTSHNRDQYFHYGDSGLNYIPRKDDELAFRLAQKDYEEKLISAFEAQLKAIDQFLKCYDHNAPMKVYEDLSVQRKRIVKSIFMSDEEYVKQWLSEPYDKLGFKNGDPVYITANGERVRSKSEMLIANELLRFGIPYRYEFPVFSDGVKIAAPDFNCLNVRLHKDYYWEHLGMMGNEEYANNNCRKMERYLTAKDFDMTKLITTYETDRHPININAIDATIRRYLM